MHSIACLIVERAQAPTKYGNRHMTGFVLSHEMKKCIDPPTHKTRLSVISETGSGAPNRQFNKNLTVLITEKLTVCDGNCWSVRLCIVSYTVL